jgi:hypothetical protein
VAIWCVGAATCRRRIVDRLRLADRIVSDRT